jgi:hypothetical protein
MLAMTIFGAAVGTFLGSQFKMFVLGPAILFALAETVAAGFIRGTDSLDIVLSVLAVLGSLQFGYVGGGVAAVYLSVHPRLPRPTCTSSQ